jgi:maleylacetate reductase
MVLGHPRLQNDFVYQATPARVVFGVGTRARLAEEVSRLGLSRVLFLSAPHLAEIAGQLVASLGGACVGAFDGARMHTPVGVTEQAMQRMAELQVDGVVAIGGGSVTGLAKALALRTDVPQIVLPTTYAGSEMTPILGETRDGVKTTQRSPKVLPETVIYDVELTLGMPAGLSGASGMNAMAHALEALYAQDANPITSLLAAEGLQALYRSLPIIHQRPGDLAARTDALYGAWLCGVCLGSVGMALHHKLCHTLGGAFDLPHAETHTILLPHVLAYNSAAIAPVMARLSLIFDHPDPAAALYDLSAALGAHQALRSIGAMPASGIDAALELALKNPYWNPRPLERSGLRGLIERAYYGAPPLAGA